MRGIVFIHATQVIDASSKNAFIYGGSASGLTIPINLNDPSGKICGSCAWSTLVEGVQSGSILNSAYKGFDAGVQLLSGTGQLMLGATMGRAGAVTGNSSLIAGGSYMLTAGAANIQGAGRKYFNIAVNEDFAPTDNFLQNTYESAARAAGLNPKVGTAAYNVAELGTGVYAEFNPVKIADDFHYGLTVTGPKYSLPIFQEFQESKAIGTNAVLGLVKGGYDAWDSTSGAAGGFLLYPNKPNTNQTSRVYAK